MMGRKTARNMLSSNTNKTGIQCICWYYSQGHFLSWCLWSCALRTCEFGQESLKNKHSDDDDDDDHHQHHQLWPSSASSTSHLRLGLSSGLFLWGFPTKTSYMLLLTHVWYSPLQSHSSRFYHSNNIGWSVQITKLLMMYSPVTASL